MAIVFVCSWKRFLCLQKKDPKLKKKKDPDLKKGESPSSSPRKKAKFVYASVKENSENDAKISLTASSSSPTHSTSPLSSALPEDLCPGFSLAEIKKITKNLRVDTIIGVGGSSTVYKGYSEGHGGGFIAIKRLNREIQMKEAQEFRTEVQLLAQLSHPNLVSLLGFCTDKEEMMVVYNYMPNGPLRDHLYGTTTNKNPLSWKDRLDICIGAAQGLQYIHSGLKHTVIHRKVSTRTILLDEILVAKISGLALSRIMETRGLKAHGLVDLEYANHGKLTEKCDVYSFGVVLLEVLCAKPPIDKNLPDGCKNLVDLFRSCVHKNELDPIIDPYLMGKIKTKCFWTFVNLAVGCLLDDGLERP